MAKRRLSKQQQRRIHRSQANRLVEDKLELDASTSQTARVISHHGKALYVETETREKISCHIRQNLGDIACGDFVVIQNIIGDPFQRDDSTTCVVTAVKPRSNLLTKSGFGGAIKTVAANIDQLVIVVSVMPRPNSYLIDRYLIAAENLPARAVIVVNKSDLIDAQSEDEIRQLTGLYQSIGYPVLHTSVKSGEGLSELKQILDHSTSILVGLSGVGKSSLVNALLPGESIRIGDTSSATGEGKHTTTVSALYHLGDDGVIIDSPGVRDFTPSYASADEITRGFIELQDYANQCKFSNCSHNQEPGCAVNQAMSDGKITQQRVENYRRLIQEVSQSDYR
jgi:ribosome biogenesis GTPase